MLLCVTDAHPQYIEVTVRVAIREDIPPQNPDHLCLELGKDKPPIQKDITATGGQGVGQRQDRLSWPVLVFRFQLRPNGNLGL
jgi:hypothetical protein